MLCGRGHERKGWSCLAGVDCGPFSAPGRTSSAISFSVLVCISDVNLKLLWGRRDLTRALVYTFSLDVLSTICSLRLYNVHFSLGWQQRDQTRARLQDDLANEHSLIEISVCALA
jgi:hypothetical protein